jgi:nucleotide-binding universal stress UspA family protein
MKVGDVLFPTDFSPASEAAARTATEMARQWGVTLHIIHVVPPVTDPGDSVEALSQASATLGNGLRMETALLNGRVANQIIRYARDKHIALIVLGTHGRTGLSRALLGSVAESVARLAQCPVLTVPPVVGRAAPAEVSEAMPPARHSCIVCDGATDDLICETCRSRIRGSSV